jgi:hypothetical protein
MYTIKKNTNDDVWPDAFQYAVSKIMDETALRGPEYRREQLYTFCVSAVSELASTRNFDTKRILAILESCKSPYVSVEQLKSYYNNLHMHKSKANELIKNKSFAEYGVLIVVVVIPLLIIILLSLA